MDSGFDFNRLMLLRSLTTALAQHFETSAREHLGNLAALLQPRALLGDLIRLEKAPATDQEAAFRELLKQYQPIARTSIINTQVDLKPPLDIYTSTLELTPASYSYTPEGSAKPVTIVTPMKWVVAYKDLGLARLREHLASHNRSGGNELQSSVLHYLVLHLLVARRPGAAPIMEALRFGLTSTPNAEFGGLPVIHLSAPLPTVRPPDAVIAQSTMISGATSFEEVVDLAAIGAMRDPMKDRVLELLQQHASALAGEVTTTVE
ncbi:hypothetical protein BH11PSE9_BH11PSE9_04240 [soil metagenome]